MDRDGVGAWGEDRAAAYLRRRGYRILERNFSCRQGEIDIIARKGEILAFVEVKLRKAGSYVKAREYVTWTKQRRVIQAAGLWLAAYRGPELQPRFDVIEVYAPQGTKTFRPEIEHIEDAFR